MSRCPAVPEFSCFERLRKTPQKRPSCLKERTFNERSCRRRCFPSPLALDCSCPHATTGIYLFPFPSPPSSHGVGVQAGPNDSGCRRTTTVLASGSGYANNNGPLLVDFTNRGPQLLLPVFVLRIPRALHLPLGPPHYCPCCSRPLLACSSSVLSVPSIPAIPAAASQMPTATQPSMMC